MRLFIVRGLPTSSSQMISPVCRPGRLFGRRYYVALRPGFAALHRCSFRPATYVVPMAVVKELRAAKQVWCFLAADATADMYVSCGRAQVESKAGRMQVQGLRRGAEMSEGPP